MTNPTLIDPYWTFWARAKLAANLNWRWDDAEFGAPAVDPKRPYGNSDALADMREILGLETGRCVACGEYRDDAGVTDEELLAFHAGMVTWLQRVVATEARDRIANVTGQPAGASKSGHYQGNMSDPPRKPLVVPDRGTPQGIASEGDRAPGGSIPPCPGPEVRA